MNIFERQDVKKFAMDDYQKLLETVKKQYQHFVEIRQLCELVSDDVEPENSQSPSPDDPATANENQLCLPDPRIFELEC